MKAKSLMMLVVALLLVCGAANAQRYTDKLTRGLVAIPQGDKDGQDGSYGMSGTGIFVSWRILPGEYFDTGYNLYRGTTKLNEKPLTVSNYEDTKGSKTSVYKVVPVVRGVEREDLAATATPWAHQYWDIPAQKVLNRNGDDVTSTYSLNDCSVADVDGDGQMEFVAKRIKSGVNSETNKTDFNLHECYKMDGTRLWWIDMGPNLMAGPDEQFDLILYDWDQDGKAEALMRGADNMIIHTAANKIIKIGNMNYYAPRAEYTHEGAEYLLYLNGETGEPYGWDGSENWTPAAYPLPRFETGESDYATVWGAGDTGHRSAKHYFGAPYLDGRNPSIFLGRGCYTRHKFCALSVNKETHELTQLWRWNCYDSKSAWFGNGFHNFAIADVDMDGRDEIVFGSMIIDDTGYGLSTTGFGHGDAQHCGDLDPYRWGLEQFVCLEGSNVPGIAYTDGMSSTLRFTTGTGADNGRCMAGNFQSKYPGAIGVTFGYDAISLVSDKVITGVSGWGDDHMNMRVYWDGDLLDEFMDSPGTARSPYVYKAPGQTEVGTGRSYLYNRCWGGSGNLNNSSKNNPCFLGDIIGDWREEIVNPVGDAIRINVSSYPSPWGITSLWYDHEYRNGMTWQSVGYNQPPHPSFFLGELEGITNCPPAITLEGRTEVQNGGTIQSTDAQLLVSGYENKTISVQNDASPYLLIVNAPAWVKGSGARQAVSSTPKQPQRTIETYTTTLTGGAFSGATRLVKQGEGILVLPNVVEKHTGNTDVWNGTLQFDGTFESSPLWLNRHTTLISDGGKFMGGLKADYNATIYPGKDKVSSITASKLELGFGSRIVLDGANGQFDQVNASQLTIESKTATEWVTYGPRYKAPVIVVNYTGTLADGTYELGTVGELTGTLADINIEGLDNTLKSSLVLENGKLKLVIKTMRAAGEVMWNGTSDKSIWQQGVSENFLANGVADCSADGDDVIFNDNAAQTTLSIKGAVSPKSVTFNNETKNYVVNGDSIVGGGPLVKNGKGTVTLNNWNHIGNTTVNGGTLVVTALANNAGQTWGALGSSKQAITLNDGSTLRTNGVIITDQTLNVSGEVSVDVPSGKSVIFNKAIKGNGATINKTGAGSMETSTESNTYSKLVVKAGTVTSNYSSSFVDQLPATVEFQGGTLWTANNEGTNINNNSNYVVPQGKTGTLYGGFRSTYTGTLTGEGTFNVYTGGVRCYFDGDWSAFAGTINIGKNNRQNKKSYDPDFYYRNTKGLPLATVNVNEKARFSNEGKSIVVKKLGGKGTLTGSGQWIVDNDDNFTMTTEVGITSARTDDYGNSINKSTSPLTKRGSGKMTMTAGNMYGALTIEGGTVTFNDTKLATLLHGEVTTTIKTEGRLVGQGLLNAVSLQKGGELMPCGSTFMETTPGTIKCNNTINSYAGSTIVFIRNASKNSTLDTKNLTLNGTVKVTLLSGYTPKAGDAFTLWTVSGTLSGTPSYDLPALPEGLYWDIRGLSEKTGVLRVTDDITVSGVKMVKAENTSDRIYDLQGKQVRIESLKSGVYVRGGKKIVVK